MSDPRYGLTGKTLKGRINFVAATQGELILKQGGQWKSDDYALQVQALARQFDQVDVTLAVNLTLYTVTIDGRAYPFTSDATATPTEIRDGLIAAINLASPANGVAAAIVDVDTLSILGLVGGVPHAVSVGTNLALVSGLETVPNFSGFKDDGRVVVRTASAFTGAFDVLVQG